MNEPNPVTAMTSHMSARDAKLTATEILLADPESLGDDVLESALYMLRERLQDQGGQ